MQRRTREEGSRSESSGGRGGAADVQAARDRQSCEGGGQLRHSHRVLRRAYHGNLQLRLPAGVLPVRRMRAGVSSRRQARILGKDLALPQSARARMEMVTTATLLWA